MRVLEHSEFESIAVLSASRTLKKSRKLQIEKKVKKVVLNLVKGGGNRYMRYINIRNARDYIIERYRYNTFRDRLNYDLYTSYLFDRKVLYKEFKKLSRVSYKRFSNNSDIYTNELDNLEDMLSNVIDNSDCWKIEKEI
jgi:hypothetical protein